MKKVRVRSMAEFRALPEGEWVEVIGPMKWEVPEAAVRVRKGELVIPLPNQARKALNARSGESLEARLSGTALVVSPKRPRKQRRAG